MSLCVTGSTSNLLGGQLHKVEKDLLRLDVGHAVQVLFVQDGEGGAARCLHRKADYDLIFQRIVLPIPPMTLLIISN